MNALVTIPNANVEVYRESTDAASICRDIVVKTAMAIQGRKYVKVEGWMAIATAHGCMASARDVERVDGGVRAIGQVRRRSDGAVLCEAEGFVGEDEPTWFGGEVNSYGKTKVLPKRPDYAIRAMAQTRAISRACRSAFAHVVVMMDAGLSTTPAEEVPAGGFEDEPQGAASAERPKSVHATRKEGGDDKWEEFQAALHKCETLDDLERVESDPKLHALYRDFPPGWKRNADELTEATRSRLEEAEAALDSAAASTAERGRSLTDTLAEAVA